MKTEKITINGTEYTLKPFTLDQLVEVSEAIEEGGGQMPFKSAAKILKIALAYADPPVADPGKLVLSFADVGAANAAILRLSGIEVKEAGPQQADAPAA